MRFVVSTKLVLILVCFIISLTGSLPNYGISWNGDEKYYFNLRVKLTSMFIFSKRFPFDILPRMAYEIYSPFYQRRVKLLYDYALVSLFNYKWKNILSSFRPILIAQIIHYGFSNRSAKIENDLSMNNQRVARGDFDNYSCKRRAMQFHAHRCMISCAKCTWQE